MCRMKHKTALKYFSYYSARISVRIRYSTSSSLPKFFPHLKSNACIMILIKIALKAEVYVDGCFIAFFIF